MGVPAGSSGLVSLDDVKTHLHIDLTDTDQDAELQGFIDAATPIIEDVVGPVVGRVFTEWHAANGDLVLLRRRPVISISSVTEYAGAAVQALTEQTPGQDGLDAFGFFVEDYDAGIIQRTAYGTPSWFGVVPWVWAGQQPALYVAPRLSQLGQGRVKVVYTAGRSVVPANVRMGTLELIRHTWQIERGGRVVVTGPGFDDGMVQTPSGYWVPNRVLEALGPSSQTHQIA